ncbi:UNVERIFIED_CONTAM: hypothetical protein Sradi_5801300 [Sesamum radiatum]|uniref:Retrotransposon Copia-like N-terminal domain-containing protein n=1 Tax=Sesamum radiatum TaxID=300843 RepID=A0AAW2KRE2_SESRA
MAGKNVEGGGISTEEQKQSVWPERLRLYGGDHPGMSLVSVPLDGSNYLLWSQSVRLALGAKQKVGFIDGTCAKPAENKEELEQWQRVDCMILSWLLNSISKDIAEAFLYTTSAHELWKELETRFGDSNGPMLYDVQKRITSLTQAHLNPLPKCTCGSSKAMADMNSSNQVIQFLMGLEESYDNVRSQMLLMDPLPTIGKAYSMLLRIEKQKEVHVGSSQDGAMTARLSNAGKLGMNVAGQKRRGQLDKKAQYCDHCRRNGHTRESCFQLTGFPEWYRVLMDQKKMQEDLETGHIMLIQRVVHRDRPLSLSLTFQI